MATSKIQEIIDDMYEYIEECKAAPFSSNKIQIEKDQLFIFLDDLSNTVPDEVKRYQKVLNNREEILNDAREKAKQIIEEAKKQKQHIVSESDIVKQAYAQANEIIEDASDRARTMLTEAQNDADQIRTGALSYTEDMLANVESLLSSAFETTGKQYEKLMVNLENHLNTVIANRRELGLEPEKDEYGIYFEEEPQGYQERQQDYEDDQDMTYEDFSATEE